MQVLVSGSGWTSRRHIARVQQSNGQVDTNFFANIVGEDV